MLNEGQIQRYSRQILLSRVGGAGQELLLRARVDVRGTGTALTTAVSYLATAGVLAELCAHECVTAEDLGFLAPASSLGSPWPEVMAQGLARLDSRADSGGLEKTHLRAVLHAAPGKLGGDANVASTVVGSWRGKSAVVHFPVGAVARYADSMDRAAPTSSGADGVLAGALAAWVVIRSLLEPFPTPRGWILLDAGGWGDLDLNGFRSSAEVVRT